MNKKEIIKYLKENEIDIQQANTNFIPIDLALTSYVNSDKIHGIEYSPIFSFIFNNNSKPFFQFIPRHIIKKVTKKVYLDYCQNPKTLKQRMEKQMRLKKKIDKLWKEYLKNRDNLSDKELLQFYQNFITIAQEWWYYAGIGEDKGEVINQEITPRFAKRHHLTIKEAKDKIITLSFPRVQSIFNDERKDFLNICLKVSKKKNVDKEIKEYIDNYFWIKTNYRKALKINPESLLKEVFLEIKRTSEKLISKELRSINQNFKNIQNEKKKLLLELKPTSQDKKDFYFAQQYSYWMDLRKSGMMIQFHYLLFFLEDIAKRYKINPQELFDYSVQEIENFLKTKGRVRGKKKGGFILYQKNKKVKTFRGKDGEQLLRTATFIKEQDPRGQVASNGNLEKIQGKVKIIHEAEKEKFNKGDILVTSMTRTEFIPLMRRAKAIITDEGGIACHAAIISRELGIPAIIGTKNATRILKTGNEVELDLKTGIIKVIK